VTSETLRLLLVDDNAGDMKLAQEYMRDAGMDVHVRTAPDGAAALDLLRGLRAAGGAELPDIVLTDLHMPRMDGLQLVEALHAEFVSLPVILMTAFGSEEIAYQSLLKGASSYVPKKDMREGLVPTLQQIGDLARSHRQDHEVQSCCVASESTWVLGNDITLVPALARQLGGLYQKMMGADENEQFHMVVALHEAMSNAIYHGNLEVSSSLRRGNLDDDAFHRVAEEHKKQSPYRDRRVHVRARITPDQATIVVQDEGPGFNVASLPDPRDRSNLEEIGGRGLFLIRLFMTEVRHDARGREITMIKRRAQPQAAAGG
jgi:CheY-like chemotaxis protein/anti-sigma regulatory factor (Ser/Thr protein kinase)